MEEKFKRLAELKKLRSAMTIPLLSRHFDISARKMEKFLAKKGIRKQYARYK